MNDQALAALLRERDELREHCSRLQASLSRTGFPPGHFYSPLTDESDPLVVAATIDRLRHPQPLGIELDLERMKALVTRLSIHHKSWPFPAVPSERFRYHYENPFFGAYDGGVYFSMLLEHRPKRVVEVGCGYSSRLLLDTRDEFLSERGTEITLIDPELDRLSADLRGQACHLQCRLQEAPLTIFEALGDGDFLFIDSSHVCKTGSDVNHYLFEIFPRLQAGVIIHIHDILYPFEYPAAWVLDEKRSWNEAYFIRAFLQGNPAFEILLWNNFFFHKANEYLEAAVPLCMLNEGGSLWLRKKNS